MIFEIIPNSFQENILFKRVFQYLLNFRWCFGLKNRRFLFKHDTDTIEWENLKGLRSYDSVKDKKILLYLHIADETVEDPREHNSQRLNFELLQFLYYFLLGCP
jgi:hypothetical protein